MDFIDITRSSTPNKARLGKFVDAYSPEHLNLSPTCQKGSTGRYDILTPDNLVDFKNKCWTVNEKRTKRCNVQVGRLDMSFEANQSFPSVNKKYSLSNMEAETLIKNKLAPESYRVDGPNGLRFNTSLTPSEVPSSAAQSQAGSQHQNTKAVFTIEPNSYKILIVNNKACSLLGYSSTELCGLRFSELLRNRSKKFQLPDHKDSYVSDDGTIVLLSGKVVELSCKDGTGVQVSLWIRQFERDGPCVVVAEPVSCRSVVLIVDRDSGLIVSVENTEAAEAVFQCESVEALSGLHLSALVPTVTLPHDRLLPREIAKQKLTGRTLDGVAFPLCLWISKLENYDIYPSLKTSKDKYLLEVNIKVTDRVGGLLVVDEWGVVTACNPHFCSLVLGQGPRWVRGAHITALLPGFCREAGGHPRSTTESETSEESCAALNGSQRSACVAQPPVTSLKSATPTQDMVSSISTEHRLQDLTSRISGISIEDDIISSISKSRSENLLRSEHSNVIVKVNMADQSDSLNSEEMTPTGQPRSRNNDPSYRLSLDSSRYRNLKVKDDRSSLSLDFCDSNETSADFLTPINEMPVSGVDDLPRLNGISMDSLSNEADLETQTESAPRKLFTEDSNVEVETNLSLRPCLPYGTFRGVIIHRDETPLNVVYSVSAVGSSGVRHVWVSLADQITHPAHPPASQASTTDNSLLMGNKSASSRPHSMSLLSQCGEEQVAGDYHKHYVTLRQIGKGAYGCVRLAYRRSDRLLCVAKFIPREKVRPEFWVTGPDGATVPLEISLLTTIKHANIVSVLDVFNNEKYFQVVMERHGAGMDLFEFIERRPKMDEPLISYIFRQIGLAVEYLHSLNILHRDIKDENVIIDNKFHIKLIDFGSATFMSKDKLFSTFYGTTEYCSPEVLAGNKYAGPELEMWSMGVTLYVLVFFVSPFSDVEETVQSELVIPHPVSEDLDHLLRWMLCKCPVTRCTVPQLMSHAWINQPVHIHHYVFHEIVDCDRTEYNPEMYYNGSVNSPRSGSLLSLGEQQKERSLPSEAALRSEGRRGVRPGSALIPVYADKELSDNYSLRSSADILDISSKPVSEAITDMSSDATGHAACDIDCDCDQLDDTWDECEQDSL